MSLRRRDATSKAPWTGVYTAFDGQGSDRRAAMDGENGVRPVFSCFALARVFFNRQPVNDNSCLCRAAEGFATRL
jgi:hypothetical protein